jgi:hypothetical protein
MKRNTKGLTSIEVIIIIAIVIIIGVIVYLSTQSSTDVNVAPQNVVNSTPTPVANNATPDNAAGSNTAVSSTEPTVTAAAPAKQVTLTGDALMVSYVKEIRADADAKFNGKFSSTFVQGNNAKTVGAGIVPGTVGKKIIEGVKAANGNIFAITNGTGPTAYAIYAALPSKSGSYYCNASDGSTKEATTKVADNITGLGTNPICK